MINIIVYLKMFKSLNQNQIEASLSKIPLNMQQYAGLPLHSHMYQDRTEFFAFMLLYQQFQKCVMQDKKGNKQLHQVLKTKNFFRDGMNEFPVKDIVLYLKFHHMFEQFVDVVIGTNMNHYTLTKTILIIFSLLQSDQTVKDHQLYSVLMNNLTQSANSLKVEAGKQYNNNKNYLSPQKKSGLGSLKRVLSFSTQNNYSNSYYLIHHILEPLISILKRIEANYDQVYRPQVPMNVELCWATINFLHKFGDLHKSFEEIGRYYFVEFVRVIFQILKVIDVDIAALYRNTSEYLQNQIDRSGQDIIDEEKYELTPAEQNKLKQLLMFVNQMELLNDDLRVLYCGRYFGQKFHKCGIKAPQFFKAEEKIEYLDNILKSHQRSSAKRLRISAKSLSYIETSDTPYSKQLRETFQSDAFLSQVRIIHSQ